MSLWLGSAGRLSAYHCTIEASCLLRPRQSRRRACRGRLIAVRFLRGARLVRCTNMWVLLCMWYVLRSCCDAKMHVLHVSRTNGRALRYIICRIRSMCFGIKLPRLEIVDTLYVALIYHRPCRDEGRPSRTVFPGHLSLLHIHQNNRSCRLQ